MTTQRECEMSASACTRSMPGYVLSRGVYSWTRRDSRSRGKARSWNASPAIRSSSCPGSFPASTLWSQSHRSLPIYNRWIDVSRCHERQHGERIINDSTTMDNRSVLPAAEPVSQLMDSLLVIVLMNTLNFSSLRFESNRRRKGGTPIVDACLASKAN